VLERGTKVKQFYFLMGFLSRLQRGFMSIGGIFSTLPHFTESGSGGLREWGIGLSPGSGAGHFEAFAVLETRRPYE
jgi:hypothetical protein